jgi:signal transduction histidine kinase
LILLFTTLIVGSMLAFTLRVVHEETESRSEATKVQAVVLARNLAVTGADHLLSRDYTSIEHLLLRAAQFRNVLTVQMSDVDGDLIGDVYRGKDGEPAARYGQAPLKPPKKPELLISKSNHRMTVWHPLELGAVIGWVKIVYSLEEIEQAATRIWTANIITGLVITIVAVGLVCFLLRRPIRSIQSYTEFADNLDSCAGDQIDVDKSATELDRLGESLNNVSLRLYGQSAEIQQAITQLERLAAFAEDSPNFVISLDKEAKIQYINPRCLNYLANLDLREQDLHLLLPDNINTLSARVISEERTFREIDSTYQDRYFQWTFAPVRGQDVLHAYGSDVTEKRRAEEQAQAALVEKLGAISANKAKSQFLANMSHELRTPLNAIIGYSELLAEDAEETNQRDLMADLRKIDKSGKYLLALINEILDLSKIESGKMELYLDDFDVSRIVNEVATTVTPLAEKNNNRLAFKCDDELGVMYADSTKLRQVLLNLLSNACKFTRDGTIDFDVSVDTIDGEPGLKFVISDQGIGMTDAQLKRVFEPFTQADYSISQNYGGTGLGLAISKRFCEMMGGRIEAESMVGKGTRFIVLLPRHVLKLQAREQEQCTVTELTKLSHKSASVNGRC